MMSPKVQSPVAFIVFNRPELTERVFAAIAAARPTTLLIVADGPRVDRPGEAALVDRVRSIIAGVDWECDVRTNYADVNLGCKSRVSSGLDWVFRQVSECIVLEDDCLPDPSFFRFCDEMLERYRDDARVFHVNGTNFPTGTHRTRDSYYFSGQAHVWGWASWADRWLNHYDVEVSAWPRIREEGSLADIVGGKQQARYWRDILDRLACSGIDTWDYQWFFACMLNEAVAVAPAVNLISNIGFGGNATHTTVKNHQLANLPREQMQFPLRHPVGRFRRISLDNAYFNRYLTPELKQRVVNRVRRKLERAGYRGMLGRLVG